MIPQNAVEAMLAAGRYPQDPAIRWARVAVGLQPDGSPRFLLRVPVHPAQTDAAIDWNLPGDEPVLRFGLADYFRGRIESPK